MAVPAAVTDHAVLDWAHSGSWLETEAGSVFVRDVRPDGPETAPPVLVLHGFPTCSFDWRHVVDAMAPGRRVLTFDFLGFGLSDKPDRRYGIHLHADVAEAVVRHAGIERLALVTHDMGDSVGGELLARDLDGRLGVEVVERVLANGSIYLDLAHLTPGQHLLLELPDERVDGALVGGDAGDGFGAGLAVTFSPDHPASTEELAAQWQLVSLHDGHTLLPRTIRYLEDRRREERRYTGAIERHPSPLTVVWGDADPVARHEMTAELVRVRPDARLVTLRGVGHYPMVEAPDAFAGAVRRALEGGSDPAG